MTPLTLDGEGLRLDDVVRVAHDPSVKVTLSPQAHERVERSRRAVEEILASGRVVYGVNTGFGHLADHLIPPDRLRELQRNILMSHAAGVGPELDEPTVRAVLLARANALAKGHSGVRPATLQGLLHLLNRGVHPVVPSQGSLGTSGDLAPLAHVGLVLIGLGEAHHQGHRLPGAEALRAAGLQPLVLEAKEGLALTNGTALMAGLGALVTARAEAVCEAADVAAALSLEALAGTDRALDPRIHDARPHPRQVVTAAFMRNLLQGSTFVRRQEDPHRVQDAYSLRCIPQVHGAVRDTATYARWALEIELNSATDNPLIFWEEDQPVVISGGNFHGEPVALAMDYLAMGLTELGSISERRINRLLDPARNGHLLPPFLAEDSGVNSGLMLAQYTAAALVSENKVLAHPASADTIPVSADTEDHNSMGAAGTLKARRVVEHLEQVVGIELLCAAQALDLRQRAEPGAHRMGRGTAAAHRAIRQRIPFLERDQVLHPLLRAAAEIVSSGELLRRVHEALG